MAKNRAVSAKENQMNRRQANRFLFAAALALPLASQAAGPVIDVYKTATCGCCHKWVDHLRANGFTVNAHDVADPGEFRAKVGIPALYGSCHTAMVKGYAVEGHVPAFAIRQLLAEKPKAAGLAVPGMPAGSPGMEGAYSEPYDVLLVKRDGSSTVYKHVK
jgi:hypothetical protein